MQCLAAGCNDCLAKPIDRDALLRKIAEYVGNSSTEEERAKEERSSTEYEVRSTE